MRENYKFHVKRPKHEKGAKIQFDCDPALKEELKAACDKKHIQIRVALQEAIRLWLDCKQEYDICNKCGLELERPFCNIDMHP